MSESIFKFTLENCLAATSAVKSAGDYYAADGIEPLVFRPAGDPSVCRPPECPIKTCRPYSALRADPQAVFGRYSAAVPRTGTVYSLDGCFRETGAAQLYAPEGESGVLADANIYYSSGEPLICGAYARGAYSYSRTGGAAAEKLYTPPDDGDIKSFLYLGNGNYAAVISRNGLNFIAVREGALQTDEVPARFVPRFVFAGDDGLYCLFGEGYIYNSVARVFYGGKLALPAYVT